VCQQLFQRIATRLLTNLDFEIYYYSLSRFIN
jgi:hypothetical protein